MPEILRPDEGSLDEAADPFGDFEETRIPDEDEFESPFLRGVAAIGYCLTMLAEFGYESAKNYLRK